jgi:hypothetical protein
MTKMSAQEELEFVSLLMDYEASGKRSPAVTVYSPLRAKLTLMLHRLELSIIAPESGEMRHGFPMRSSCHGAACDLLARDVTFVTLWSVLVSATYCSTPVVSRELVSVMTSADVVPCVHMLKLCLAFCPDDLAMKWRSCLSACDCALGVASRARELLLMWMKIVVCLTLFCEILFL